MVWELTNKPACGKTTDNTNDAEEPSGTREGLHSVWRIQLIPCWRSYDTTPVDKHTTNSTRTQLSAGEDTQTDSNSMGSATKQLLFSSLQFTHHTCTCDRASHSCRSDDDTDTAVSNSPDRLLRCCNSCQDFHCRAARAALAASFAILAPSFVPL